MVYLHPHHRDSEPPLASGLPHRPGLSGVPEARAARGDALYCLAHPDAPEKPTVDSQSILAAVEQLELANYESFECNGLNYLLILTDRTGEEDNHSPSSRFVSTAIDGSDIYLLESLFDEVKRRHVFYLIAENEFQQQGLEGKISHQLALRAEEDAFGPRSHSPLSTS